MDLWCHAFALSICWERYYETTCSFLAQYRKRIKRITILQLKHTIFAYLNYISIFFLCE